MSMLSGNDNMHAFFGYFLGCLARPNAGAGGP